MGEAQNDYAFDHSAQIIIRSTIHTVPPVFYRAAKELGVKIEVDVR
jgi:hypothetical protein